MTSHIARLFTPAVVDRWRRSGNPDLLEMAAVIDATPLGSHEDWTMDALHRLARRAAIEQYLGAAIEAGFFKGAPGRQLRAELTGSNINNIRGAIGECTASWWLTRGLFFQVAPFPTGANGARLDAEIVLLKRRIAVEIKTPFRPGRFKARMTFTMSALETHHMGAIVKVLASAAKKFHSGMENLVVIVPILDWPVTRAVIRAFEEVPAFNIVSGALIVETTMDWRNDTDQDTGAYWHAHRCCLVRNRRALTPLPKRIWGGCPEYVGPDWEEWKPLKPAVGQPLDFVPVAPVAYRGWIGLG